jgi:serine/threonine-protein kinase
VLAVIGALAAPSLFGGSGEQGTGSNNAGPNNAGQDNAQGGGNGGGSNGGGSGDKSTSASSTPSGDAGQGGSGEAGSGGSGDGASGEQGDTPKEAAAQAIKDVYEEIDDEDYEGSYRRLSEGFKRRENLTQAGWASTFDQLKSVRFVEGPDARVSGDTAKVTGVTIAENAGKTERNTVTWRAVKEGGEWKLDAITSFDQDIISG